MLRVICRSLVCAKTKEATPIEKVCNFGHDLSVADGVQCCGVCVVRECG